MSTKYLNGLDGGSKTLPNVSDPVNPQDAASRSYVDSLTSTFSPTDAGLIAWTFDPAAITTTQTLVSGTVHVWAVPIRASLAINTVYISISTAGSGLTAGQSFVGIYQGTTRLAISASQSTVFASTGLKAISLTSAASVTPGLALIAVLCVGTTPPLIHTGGTSPASNPVAINRIGTANTSQTSLPSTLGTITQTNRVFWAGVS